MSHDTLANDPHACDSVRAQLERADAERNRRMKNIQRQRALIASIDRVELESERALASAIAAARPSEGLHSARRINEALRPQAPNTEPSVTATDPYLLSKGIPVLRLVNSKLERSAIEPVPFDTIAKASAQRVATPFKTRLQRFADRHLFSGQRPAIALVTAAFLGAALAVVAFYVQHAGA